MCTIDIYGLYSFDEILEIAGACLSGFGSGAIEGAAATMDGFIPWCNPFEDVYSDECGNYDAIYDISRDCGAISESAFLTALLPPSSVSGGANQVVTHFSKTQQTALKAGDWVMTGGATVRNKVMAGLKKEWKYSLTTTVSKETLAYPPGWEALKGLFGQRVYHP